ncbi:hypothetical protein K438DRAFT_1764400 [Mycena galopus ATCC 62051]|nr:hypothetical protein K438DRAFT_1764400 [Mycena galopus ATCC 62051]
MMKSFVALAMISSVAAQRTITVYNACPFTIWWTARPGDWNGRIWVWHESGSRTSEFRTLFSRGAATATSSANLGPTTFRYLYVLGPKVRTFGRNAAQGRAKLKIIFNLRTEKYSKYSPWARLNTYKSAYGNRQFTKQIRNCKRATACGRKYKRKTKIQHIQTDPDARPGSRVGARAKQIQLKAAEGKKKLRRCCCLPPSTTERANRTDFRGARAHDPRHGSGQRRLNETPMKHPLSLAARSTMTP